MKTVKLKVMSNTEILKGYFKMVLDAPGIARRARPGEFLQILCSEGLDPFLRRPFSIHNVKHSGVEILYNIVGRGTGFLAGRRPGDLVDTLGPLGNGFTLPLKSEKRAIIISGGIGVAPLVFLAGLLGRKGIKTTVLIGARTKKAILCEKDFKGIGAKLHIATDDGTRGFRGFVSELFEKTLEKDNIKAQEGIVYACGPLGMLKAISSICRRRKIDCELSIEERMACGIGVCLGCSVKSKKPGPKGPFRHKLTCKDGPVFKASEITLEDRR